MSDLVTGRTGDWEVVIGLEVHAQVSSNAKLFSGASSSKTLLLAKAHCGSSWPMAVRAI